jgi:DNA-binding response OmpR family regulator
MNLLVVEDDPRLADVVKRGLQEEGYPVTLAHSGEEALTLLEREHFDLLLLDMLLPRLDGLGVLRAVRQHGSDLPVLILTAKDELSDKVAGLDAGADDYLTKPFGFEELLARVRALLRRRGKTHAVLQAGDLVLDTSKRTAERKGQRIDLTNREYLLLEYLMRRVNQAVSREALAEQLGLDINTMSNVIDVHIGHLRRKIDDSYSTKLFHTARGTGYGIFVDAQG